MECGDRSPLSKVAELLNLSNAPSMAIRSKRQLIVAANAPKPVGPYSPGILAGDYLFLSGQGARDAAGRMPEGVEAQARQCLENVKAIAEAAGLNLKLIVHLQLYLEH